MIYTGNSHEVLKTFEDNSIDCCVTSPPYFGLRDYGVDGQIGLETTVEEYVEKLCLVFDEVHRVLKKEGTLWLNLGDSYNGGGRGGHVPNNTGNKNGHAKANNSDATLKPKDLMGIPWRVAFALQARGWYLRQDIIWHKPNPMPESVTDRCTKSHEYIFLLTKSQKYYFDNDAIREPYARSYNIGFGTGKEWQTPEEAGKKRSASHGGNSGLKSMAVNPLGRNKRSVWTVNTKPYKGAHFATFPPDLIEPCILAGCPENGVVLDPFFGAGTTGLVAKKHNRDYIGIELNEEYAEIARKRVS